MDIWQWVKNLQIGLDEAGQGHNAQLIEDISSYAADQEVEKAEAILPEAKALCQTLENPWLSVFVGHWEMRHRLGNKKEGESALADVVALFELAHREETQDCPQSICVTQDLAACYSMVDGKGWADERIAISEETLTRIDPSWGCFQCLSCEKALALIDQEQYQEALSYLDDTSAEIEAFGEEVYSGIGEVKNSALLKMAKYEQVLSAITDAERKVKDEMEWKNISQPRALQKAHALAALGRDDEALEALPLLSDMNVGDMLNWLQAIYPVLERRPEMNTWRLGRQMQAALKYLSEHGAHRHVIAMAELNTRLAIARDAHWIAQKQLQIARPHLASLRIDAGATALIEDLQAQIACLPEVSLPVPADELLTWLNEQAIQQQTEAAAHANAQTSDDQLINQETNSETSDSGTSDSETVSDEQQQTLERNPEQELAWLLVAVNETPDDVELCHLTAEALQACGAHEEAIALLRAYVSRHLSEENNLRFSLLNALLEVGDSQGIEALSDEFMQAGTPVFAHWCLAQLAYQQGDWLTVEQQNRYLLVHDPEAFGARSLLAKSLMHQQAFSQAAREYHGLIEALPEEQDYKWEYLTAASAAQDWSAVRQMAATLDMELTETTNDDEAPNEQWGWIIIRYIEAGEALEYYARRSGPVSAIILENAPPKNIQHVNDHIVFDAQLLYPAPEDPEQKESFIPTFSIVHTLSSGAYGNSVFVSGVHPSNDAFEALEVACEALQWQLWVHSSSDYQLIDNEQEQTALAGIMLTLAAPNTVSKLNIHEFLTQHTASWEHQMCWITLADSVGANTEPHQAAIDRYDL